MGLGLGWDWDEKVEKMREGLSKMRAIRLRPLSGENGRGGVVGDVY